MIFLAPVSAVGSEDGSLGEIKPVARPSEIPPTRWEHRPEAARWTRGALAALRTHGKALENTVPRDIAEWCPGYVSAPPPQRRAFWVGFLSALAKHESTYRPDAVGGGGKWYGLLQILPSTARGYGCMARSGSALKDGAANLSCAIRILAVTVPRDQAIAVKERRWRGVAADWGPMRSSRKRADMAGWLRQQSFCAVTTSPRPKARPKPAADIATGD
ncbi:transglycosylase SLT domain-containing protein [Roseovarius sp. ZX-A-9]|uniref:transglycosylase SLT domain-containing protein n=1 Tax=Roseovarius sp. ZX-A-9 TaxID=3014783 RepID=UPI00232FC96D|nr:transglycosylase SLT domain-containing protein [Roseovarius sp. ZX-A-9]